MEAIDIIGPAFAAICAICVLICAICLTVLLVRVAFGKRRK